MGLLTTRGGTTPDSTLALAGRLNCAISVPRAKRNTCAREQHGKLSLLLCRNRGCFASRISVIMKERWHHVQQQESKWIKRSDFYCDRVVMCQRTSGVPPLTVSVQPTVTAFHLCLSSESSADWKSGACTFLCVFIPSHELIISKIFLFPLYRGKGFFYYFLWKTEVFPRWFTPEKSRDKNHTKKGVNWSEWEYVFSVKNGWKRPSAFLTDLWQFHFNRIENQGLKP